MQCGKSDKDELTSISKPHAHLHSMKKTHVKFQNNRYKTVKEVALTRGNHCLYIGGEKLLAKPHAHPHTMRKIHATFQKDRYTTVRGIALSRHLG